MLNIGVLLTAKIVNKKHIRKKNTKTEIIQSLRPSILQYWLASIFLAFSIFLSFRRFGVNTITGISILSVSSSLAAYIIISVCTTRYLITHRGLLVRQGPFSIRFKEISYCDINNIMIKQGSVQKRFKIGNLTINTECISRILRGIKNPHKIKELINTQKASEYERRTLLRRML